MYNDIDGPRHDEGRFALLSLAVPDLDTGLEFECGMCLMQRTADLGRTAVSQEVDTSGKAVSVI